MLALVLEMSTKGKILGDSALLLYPVDTIALVTEAGC